MKEFFGFGGYQREPEGYFSWQHLTFVTSLMVIMVALAVFFGRRLKDRDEKSKNKVLVWAAILIDLVELIKIVLRCIMDEDPTAWLYVLPLFLCSIQLITIPLAAFSRGRIKEASIDFVFIFGLLGAVLGTYFAGQNYSAYPVLSFDNVISGITHSISGFCALYIAISGMCSMKKKNISISILVLSFFCVVAFCVNKLIDYNYMFLERGDGTPYDIFYNLVNGSKILYPMIVVVLFFIYILAFYHIYYFIKKKLSLANGGNNEKME